VTRLQITEIRYTPTAPTPNLVFRNRFETIITAYVSFLALILELMVKSVFKNTVIISSSSSRIPPYHTMNAVTSSLNL
jgi:hypothetical protein